MRGLCPISSPFFRLLLYFLKAPLAHFIAHFAPAPFLEMYLSASIHPSGPLFAPGVQREAWNSPCRIWIVKGCLAHERTRKVGSKLSLLAAEGYARLRERKKQPTKAMRVKEAEEEEHGKGNKKKEKGKNKSGNTHTHTHAT